MAFHKAFAVVCRYSVGYGHREIASACRQELRDVRGAARPYGERVAVRLGELRIVVQACRTGWLFSRSPGRAIPIQLETPAQELGRQRERGHDVSRRC